MAEIIQYTNGVPGIVWRLDKRINRIGRCSKSNDVHLDDGFASKIHAQIEIQLNRKHPQFIEYYIRDLDSTNKTYLNKAAVNYRQLTHNDVLTIGKTRFVFVSEGVQDYVTADMLDEDTLSELEGKSVLQPSLSETSEEICSLAVDEDVKRTSQSGHKFSRRLNFF